MLKCVNSAPFGYPVVPEVYRMTAGSSGMVGAWSVYGSDEATSANMFEAPSGADASVGSAFAMMR